MAQYLIQEDTLTGIADAIREKTGSSDSIMLNAMKDAIAGISDGMPSFVKEMSSGQWTSSNNAQSINVNHGLSMAHDIFVCWRDHDTFGGSGYGELIFGISGAKSAYQTATLIQSGTSVVGSIPTYSTVSVYKKNNSTTDWTVTASISCNSSNQIPAGVLYKWIALVLEGE